MRQGTVRMRTNWYRPGHRRPTAANERGDMSGTDVAIDLIDEHETLDAIVAQVDDAAWQLDTPSPGWTVADQIGHLAYFDTTAALAIEDPDAFVAHRSTLLALFTDADAMEAETLGLYRAMSPEQLLGEWRTRRDELAAAARSTAPDERIEWYGPSMSLRSFLTARLMETWAHGQDIVDAVGAERPPTDRLRHIAQLGVITRGWSYANRRLEPPPVEVRVALDAPSGATWTWGPDESSDRVTGPAEHFCLVVTQRRHIDDTRLSTSGRAARDWMEIAQAFAGPATDGPLQAGTDRPA